MVGAAAGNEEEALHAWKICMDAIQMLEKTIYEQADNGFARFVGLNIAMRTLELDHLHQVADLNVIPHLQEGTHTTLINTNRTSSDPTHYIDSLGKCDILDLQWSYRLPSGRPPLF